MRKKMFFKFLTFVLLATFVTFTSCKDYDDEIKNLETGLASLKSTVEEMQQKIESGSTITQVETTNNGLVISLSDGKSYTLTNGTNGEDGSVVTIGSNGNWFIDGTDTNKPSKGEDGTIGEDGVDGKDGIYYIPGEDGFWHKVEGETTAPTTDSWIIEGAITAVWQDGYVVLHNVKGAAEPIAIGLVKMNNLTLIPNLVTSDGSPLLNFNILITATDAKILQTTVQYQVSPTNATEKLIDTEKLFYKVNNPDVLTLKSASLDPKAEFVSLENGILTITASIDADTYDALTEGGEKIVQLMLVVPLTSGEEIVSDFAKIVSVDVEEILPVISVSPESFDLLSDKGEDIDFTIESNTDEWEVSNLPVWITLKDKTATSLTLTVAPNTGAERTVKLLFQLVAYPEINKEVDVTQAEMEPPAPEPVVADMLDVVFNLDGTAEDLSPMKHNVTVTVDEEAPYTVAYNETYNRNVVSFNPVSNGTNPAVGKGTFFSVNYQENTEFQNKLADGHSFETLVKFDVDYNSGEHSYETKFFSTQQSGGTGFMVARSNQATGPNGITFLPNVSTTDGGSSRWIWTNSQVKPDGESWYHLVGVWDKEAGKSYLYLNGEKVSEVDAQGFYRPATLNPLWLAIGGDPGNDNAIQGPFKGSLTIARIYDKALTGEEAKLLWDQIK